MSEIRSQATPERDELAEEVFNGLAAGQQLGETDMNVIAHAIAIGLDSKGWSKLRTVNSATELDALPDGSIIMFEGMAWQACEFVSKTYPEGYICWVCHESWRGELGSADVIPATVLFTPGEAG